jgi:hypothetical protein
MEKEFVLFKEACMLKTVYSVKAFSQEKSNSYSYYESGSQVFLKSRELSVERKA